MRQALEAVHHAAVLQERLDLAQRDGVDRVAAGAALLLYGNGAIELPYNQVFKLFNWYAMLTLPMFIYMGYMLSESGIASDLYRMFHVWTGPMRGGLAVGTILLMVAISAMNGAIGSPVLIG